MWTVTLPSCSREAKKERALGSGVEYFEKGDYAAAEIEFKNTLKADPGNLEAAKHLGIIRLNQGANYEAAVILDFAEKKLPQDDEVGVALGKSLLGLAIIPNSRKALLAVLDRSSGNGDALELLAESSLTPELMDETEQRIQKSGKKTTSTRLASALMELRRGSIENGTAIVEEVLKSDPKSVRAHSLKAAILNSKKQEQEALAELKIAADAARPRSYEPITYAGMLMTLKRRDEAVAYLEKITTATPDFLPATAMLGQIAFGEKNYELATKHFEKVLSKNPYDMAVAMMQAEILARNKEADKGAEMLEKVVTVLPPRPQLDFALAKCYISAGKVAKAAEALDRALAVAPEFTDAARLRAMILLQDGKSAEAISSLKAILKRVPDDGASRDILIRAYRTAGRNEDAIALLREKTGGDDKTQQSSIELGQLLSAEGKFDEARSIFEGAVETFSDPKVSVSNLAAITNVAAMDIRQGKGDVALKRVEDFIAAHPDSSEAYVIKASIALDLKKPEVAEQSLAKALELKADNGQAYGILIKMKSGSGQQAELLAVLDRYLKVFPGDLPMRLQRGYVLQMLGRKEEARTAFSDLIKDKPDFAPAYNNLASLELEEFGNLESAASNARKARSLDSQPAVADTLGWVEWKLGNYPAALALLIEAAGKLENNPVVLYHLGMAHYSMGQASEATAAFTKALESGSNFAEKAEVQKQLALLSEAGKATIADLEKRVSENPKDVMSRLQLSELLARSGKPEEALAAYQNALAANPAIPAALVGQSRLYAGPLNSPEKALKTALEARELAPRDPKVLAAVGSAKLLTGANEEAYGILKDAAAVLDNDTAVIFDSARAAYSLGRIEEARTVMARIATTSGDAKLFLLLTDADAVKQAGTAAEVDTTLAKDPRNVPALMLRASLDGAAGKNTEPTYLEILKIYPRFDPARVRLAAIYMDSPDKLALALTTAGEARSRMPEDFELARIFALINYRKGDFKYASQLLSELSTKRPLASDELFALGMSLANSKLPVKAREILDQAITAGLPEAEAAQAKAALSNLDQPEEKK